MPAVHDDNLGVAASQAHHAVMFLIGTLGLIRIDPFHTELHLNLAGFLNGIVFGLLRFLLLPPLRSLPTKGLFHQPSSGPMAYIAPVTQNHCKSICI